MWFTADASRTGNIFIGDIVFLESDGNVERLIAASSEAQRDLIVGVVVGLQNADGVEIDTPLSSITLPYLASTQAGKALVDTRPDVYLSFQANASLTETGRGLNYNIAIGTDDTTLGIPAIQLGISTGAVDATLPFKLERIIEDPSNTYGTGSTPRVLCSYNKHFKRMNMAGV